MYVAARTIVAPTMKERVIGYENSATDARNEMMIDKDVAKPFLPMSLLSRPR